jgi:hypothetical protein
MIHLRCVGVVVPLLLAAPPDRPEPDDAEAKKAVQAIVQEMARTPTLYARHEKTKDGPLPKFARAKLMEFGVEEKESFAKELMRRKANVEQYEKMFPLRAAVFAAVEASQQAHKVPLVLELHRDDATPKGKKKVFFDQQRFGVAVFKLEQALEAFAEAEESRNQEPAKHWRAHFDWARACLECDAIFLTELDYTLGRVRADDMPKLAADFDGWKVAFLPSGRIQERKSKDLAKARTKRLARIQEDYADTPWAHFAGVEAKRNLAMQWQAMKK